MSERPERAVTGEYSATWITDEDGQDMIRIAFWHEGIPTPILDLHAWVPFVALRPHLPFIFNREWITHVRINDPEATE